MDESRDLKDSLHGAKTWVSLSLSESDREWGEGIYLWWIYHCYPIINIPLQLYTYQTFYPATTFLSSHALLLLLGASEEKKEWRSICECWFLARIFKFLVLRTLWCLLLCPYPNNYFNANILLRKNTKLWPCHCSHQIKVQQKCRKWAAAGAN